MTEGLDDKNPPTILYGKQEPNGEIATTSVNKKVWKGVLPSDEAEIKEMVFREDHKENKQKALKQQKQQILSTLIDSDLITEFEAALTALSQISKELSDEEKEELREKLN